ncbi:hypothetical protein NLI96_g8432 [Meripilus lineatus]|uniref:hydroxyacylglutathione hydrolase n=1 Tax=Meripilus lineatus TaxID=2056292 RepID=A0AAD5V2I3_9APHY|nr:hypothetical protein NLI96_g8432 [Physisporinus lineatus]
MLLIRIPFSSSFPRTILARKLVAPSQTRFRKMHVIPVPVREDNYAYLLVDKNAKKAAAIDPYDVPKVKAAADEAGVEIVAAITTHHHFDHSGGNQATAFPNAPIYGGSKKIPALTDLVKHNDAFCIAETIHVQCIATPCHTQDSICYHVTSASDPSHPGGVFTGDTLFIAGCGRFFEGTPSEMHSSLSLLSHLPPQTIIYNGHEYTSSNLAFAKSVDPNNPGVKRLEELVRGNKCTTGLTTIEDEKEWNPFMRLDDPAIRSATKGSSPNEIMGILRDMKNNFKG